MSSRVRAILAVAGPVVIAALVVLRDNAPSIFPAQYQPLGVAVLALIVSALTPAVYRTGK